MPGRRRDRRGVIEHFLLTTIDATAPQRLQKQPKRVQRLAQVVTGRGEKAGLGPVGRDRFGTGQLTLFGLRSELLHQFQVGELQLQTVPSGLLRATGEHGHAEQVDETQTAQTEHQRIRAEQADNHQRCYRRVNVSTVKRHTGGIDGKGARSVGNDHHHDQQQGDGGAGIQNE